jgi:hypothetical protein
LLLFQDHQGNRSEAVVKQLNATKFAEVRVQVEYSARSGNRRYEWIPVHSPRLHFSLPVADKHTTQNRAEPPRARARAPANADEAGAGAGAGAGATKTLKLVVPGVRINTTAEASRTSHWGAGSAALATFAPLTPKPAPHPTSLSEPTLPVPKPATKVTPQPPTKVTPQPPPTAAALKAALPRTAARPTGQYQVITVEGSSSEDDDD